MGPRRSASDWSTEVGYPGTLYKLCKEEDVLIIPQFVPQFAGRQSESFSPRKFKESKTTDRFGSFMVSDPSKEDSIFSSTIPPPIVRIVYERPGDKETPVAIICKSIYLEFSFIHAIGKSLRPYPTLSTIKIENCCISKELVEALALILAEEPGRRITDLSLDGNDGVWTKLPLIVSFPTGIKYLSLQKCSLDDEAIRLLAEPLGYTDEKEHKLLFLNLGMNKIRDLGVSYLANALRTNRTLISLSLAGNQIEDQGVSYLTEVLVKFKLTHDEVMIKRRRVFDNIFKRKKVMEKYLEELRMKGEVESQASKSSARSTDRLGPTIKKIRGIDGKVRCYSSRDKRRKNNLGKINQGEKFKGKDRNGLEESQNSVNPTPSELLAIAQQVDSEMSPDKHPFVNEVVLDEDGLWCHGCWSLSSVNLAYNYLTEKSAEGFANVVISQGENFHAPNQGIVRLVLLPGNTIAENSEEFQKLQSAIIHRNSRKMSEVSDPMPVGSVLSARRLTSSTRKMKNR